MELKIPATADIELTEWHMHVLLQWLYTDNGAARNHYNVTVFVLGGRLWPNFRALSCAPPHTHGKA